MIGHQAFRIWSRVSSLASTSSRQLVASGQGYSVRGFTPRGGLQVLSPVSRRPTIAFSFSGGGSNKSSRDRLYQGRKTSIPTLNQLQQSIAKRRPDTSQLRVPSGRFADQSYTHFRSGDGDTSSGVLNKRRVLVGLAIGLGGLYVVTHIERVPVSGRLRFMTTSREREARIGQQVYQELTRKYKSKILPANHNVTKYVTRLARPLIAKAGLPSNTPWEFIVIDDPDMVNAMVIPGGKVFVFTGIFKVVGSSPAALATILSHEIGHLVGRHQAESASFYNLIMLLDIGIALTFGYSPLTPFLLKMVLDLPMSRAQETEADYIGLMLMAKACVDPRIAPEVWVAMQSMAPSGSTLEGFFSTHPMHDDRREYLTSHMSTALQHYSTSGCPTLPASWPKAEEFSKIRPRTRN